MYITNFPYLLTYEWTFRLLLWLGFGERCYNEHRNAGSTLRSWCGWDRPWSHSFPAFSLLSAEITDLCHHTGLCAFFKSLGQSLISLILLLSRLCYWVVGFFFNILWILVLCQIHDFPTAQFVFQVVDDHFICWAEAFKFDIVPFDFALLSMV